MSKRTTSKGARDRAAIYVRISRDSAARGLGVERQQAMCRALVERLGVEEAGVYEDNDIRAKRDARSGRIIPRPAYQRLLADVRAGRVDLIVASHQDRLVREPTELEELVNALEVADVPVHLATAGSLDLTNATGKLQARVVGAFATYEGEQKGERVAAQKKQARGVGAWTGGKRPFGYRLARTPKGDATLTVYEREATEVRWMVQRVLEGASLGRIATELNERKVPTPMKVGPWRATQVRSIIVKPLVAGLRVHGDRVVGDALWPAIVDRGAWERAQLILSRPGRKRSSSARRWTLTPFVTNEAGTPYTGSTRRAQVMCPKGDAHYYMAPGASVRADWLEREVWEAVLEVTDALGTGQAEPVEPVDDGLGARIAELEDRQARLGAMYAKGDVSDVGYAAADRELRAELRELRETQNGEAEDAIPAEVLERLAAPGGVRWADEHGPLSLSDRQAIIGALVERIIIRDRWTQHPDGRYTIVWS